MKKLLFLTGFLLCSITLFGQSITPVPVGQTWTQARTRINANDNIASDSIAYLKAATDQNYGFIESLNDSIAAHLGKINLRAPIASPTFTGTVSGITKGMVGLGNVDNESKATMFTSPVFTGTLPRLGSPVTDTLATRAYARQFGGGATDSAVFATRYYVDTEISQVEAGEFDTTAIYAELDTIQSALNDTVSIQAGYGIDLVSGTGTVTVRVDTTNEIASRAYAASVGGGAYDSTYIHYRVDSLATLVTNLRDSIENLSIEVASLWDAISTLSGGDLTAPRYSSSSIRNDSLWTVLDKSDVNTDSIPSIENFTITEDGNVFGIDHINILNDSILVFKLDSASRYGSTYLLSHDRTQGYPQLQDTSGNKTLNWTNKSVTNLNPDPDADLTAPTFVSAEVGTYNDSIVVSIFSEPLHLDSIPRTTAFSIMAGSTTWGIEEITINYDTVFIAMDSVLAQSYEDSTITISYSTSFTALQDSSFNEVASFSDSLVTNNLAKIDYSAEFTLTSTGDGSGVATLRMRSSNTVNVTLSGNGYFYTNSGGTEGESQTWQITAGAMRTIYLKVGSSTSTMTIDYANRITRWGDADGDGWVSSSNAPSLSGDVAQMSDTALTHIRHSGSSTLSGEIGTLTALTYIRIAGAVTFSGSIAALDPTYIELSSWGNMTVSGSIAGFTDATRIVVTGSTTVSGSIAGLTTCTYFNIGGSNTVSGSITGLTNATRIQASGSNTLSGNTSIGAVYLRIYGGSSTVEWATRTWPNNCEYFNVATRAGSGWSVANITAAIAGASGVTWSGERTFDLGSANHSSMADTNQGGIWGDFSGTAAPSTLATNLKTLVRTRTVTTSLRGIVIPGGSGDGTGFPSGFGNWWRE